MDGSSVSYNVYDFNGSSYVLLTSGTIAQGIYNPPTSVMEYGGPRFCIDQNDNVVVFYRSFDGTAPGSDVNHVFARAGDINGNWVSYPNSFNAFIVDQGLSLPTIYNGSFGDVGMTKYSSNNMVNFAFPVQNLSGINYLYLAQISYKDLVANNTSALSYQTLASSGTNSFAFPSIDGSAQALKPAIEDNWVAAYDEVHGRNDVRVVKGDAGSFVTQPYMSTLLFLGKQTGPPEINYLSDFIGLAFTANDSNPCKDQWDPIYVALDQEGVIASPHRYRRLNIDSYLTGDQKSLSFTAPVSGTSDAYISYFDQVNQKIMEAFLDLYTTCGEVTSSPIQNKSTNFAKPKSSRDLDHVDIYSLDGRLIKQFDKNIDKSALTTGIYIAVRHYADGTVETTKEGIVK